ncbi:MAG: DNA translocase FtsK, partial [Solirubrobacterales bacterium]|nr:DNA translocase FtsK [Solirubrobacterales bacterium]
MATRQKRRTKPLPRRATRSLFAGRPSLPTPTLELEPHHVDVIALAMIALGIFLGGVAYMHWAGGTLGDGAVRGTKFLFGALGYAVPAALIAGGGLILVRELRPPARPLRTGLGCLVSALTLALAAGTLGLGPGATGARAFWHPAAFETRGGVLGQGELWVASHLLSTLGAHILAVFMFITGLILVSGATLAGVLRATGAGVLGTGRALRRSSEELAATVARRPATEAGRASAAAGGSPAHELLPPEPDTAELVVRATHVEAPPIEPEELADGPEQGEQPIRTPEVVSAGEPPAMIEPDRDLTPRGRYRASITDDPEFQWRVPAPRFLTRSTGDAARPDTAGQEQVAATLLETLGHFGIEATVVGRVTGPHITRYELRLAPGTKVAKVAQLKDDLAYALAATDIRILAPIPGKHAVGVEVPNARRRIVHLGDVFQSPPPDWSPLTVWLGKDIAGRAIGADLAKMPHLLVAGTTGSGKSACVNAMLSSILLRATPHEVRVVLVDPKQVELNHYESIPHLLTPVITSPRMAANALQNLVKEMEQRYGIMSLARTRSLPELNRTREKRGEPPLPYVLCVIDELADLMMV